MQVADDARGREGMEEPDRFGAVFFAHAARLVRLAALLGDDDPEDVVQESFCKLYAARGRLHADEREGAWPTSTGSSSTRSAAGTADAWWRAATRTCSSRRTCPTTTGGHATGRPSSRRSPALPPRQREALVLRFWMDLPLATIAEAMGVRIGTVKSQISRGLAVVGAALGEEVDR